jgi:hypothetical protein
VFLFGIVTLLFMLLHTLRFCRPKSLPAASPAPPGISLAQMSAANTLPCSNPLVLIVPAHVVLHIRFNPWADPAPNCDGGSRSRPRLKAIRRSAGDWDDAAAAIDFAVSSIAERYKFRLKGRDWVLLTVAALWCNRNCCGRRGRRRHDPKSVRCRPCKGTDHKKLQIASVKQLLVFSLAAIQKGAEEFKQRHRSYGGPSMTKLCDASSRRYRCNVGFPTPLP